MVNDEIVFRKNGEVGFITLRYLCHKHIFDIVSEIFGLSKSHLKQAKEQTSKFKQTSKQANLTFS